MRVFPEETRTEKTLERQSGVRCERTAGYTARYTLIQGLNWSAFAVIWVYVVVLLRGYGMSYGQAGVVTALANILAVLAQQRFSAWVDRTAGASSGKAAIGLMAFGAAIALLFLLAGPGRALTAGVCFCLIGVTIMGVQPFINTIAMERVQRGQNLNYGLARGVGSVCYALASALAGLILKRFGSGGLLTVYILLNLACICTVLTFSADGRKVSEERRDGGLLGAAALLRQRPRFCWFLAAGILLYTAHMMATTYMDAVVHRAGGTEAELGLVVAVGAAAELPAMALLQRIRGRFSAKQILLFSAAAFVVKLLCLAAAMSMIWVYLARVLQFAEYGIFTGMSVYYVADIIEPANQAKGQAMCSSASALGAVFGNYAGGVFIERLGVGNAMLVGALLAAAGLLLLTRCFERDAARRMSDG